MRFLFVWSTLSLFSCYTGAQSSEDFNVAGTITGATCNLAVATNNTIVLPTRSYSGLQSVGATAGKQDFQISVSGCATKVSLYFQSGQKEINAAGRLNNTAQPESGRAQNIELQILNQTGLPLKLAAAKGQQESSIAEVGANANAAIFKFSVQYYAIGAATAGKVSSSLTFIAETF